MSVVQVQAAGQNALERAQKLLSGIEGGVDKAVRSAMQRATSHLRTNSAKAIRERYAISAANIRDNETVTVRYTYQNGVQAFVTFAGQKIPLYRYDGAAPALPTPDKTRWVKVPVDGKMTWVHPGIPAHGHQLKNTSPYQFLHAFVAQMPSGHIGIFQRTGGVTSTGKGELHEVMGSSVSQMLGSQEVLEKLTNEAAEKFNERLDHEIWRILNGYGG